MVLKALYRGYPQEIWCFHIG